MYQITRTIAIAVIASTSALIPNAAYSLGIGDIKLRSGFNQNLKAEIEIVGAADEQINNLYVNLAPPEKFDEAGVPWSYFLKNIKFKPVRRTNGSAYIEVTSHEALKELFLSFVLEVSWNKNDILYREFTVLIEPTTTYNPPVAQTVRKAKHTDEENNSFDGIIARSSEQDTESQGEFLLNERAIRKKTVRVHKTQYGPVKRSDFIWKVAKKTRYKGVSIEQMIIALFQTNPTAFYTDNINALTAKKILKIPEKEVVLAMSRKEALAEVNQQNEMWKERLSAKASGLQPATEVAKADSQQLAGEKNAEIKTTSVSAHEVSNENVVPDKEKQSATITSAEGLALLAKLEKLEQKLDMIQSKLGSKNEPNVVTQPTLPVESSVNDSDKEMAKPSVSSSEGLALFAKQNELEKKLEMIQKMPVATDTNAPVAILPEQKKTAAPLKNHPEMTALDARIITKKEQAKLTVKNTNLSTSTVPTSETTPISLIISGLLGGIFFSTLGVFWWRRRKSNQEKADINSEEFSKFNFSVSVPPMMDSIFIKPADSLNIDSTMVKNSVRLATDSLIDKDTGFLQDEHHDTFDAASETIHLDVEADMYLAYGYYDKAESLMRHAIKYHPENDDYKLKLLSILHTNQNKEAFELYMQELMSLGKHNDSAFWEAVMAMAIEFEIESVDITHRARIVDNTKAANNTLTKTNEPTIFDLSIFEIESNTNKKVESINDTFDLSVFDENTVESDEKIIDNGELYDNEVSFDLPNIDDEIDDFENLEVETIDNTENEITFDLSAFNDDLENSENTEVQSIDNTENEIAFDLSAFNDDLENSENTEVQSIDNAENEIAFDLSAFDDDLENSENTEVQSIDNTEHEIAFNNNKIENIENAELQVIDDKESGIEDFFDNEISFDLSAFEDDENEIEGITNGQNEEQEEKIEWADEIQAVSNEEVSFDISDFAESNEEVIVSAEVVSNKVSDIDWADEIEVVNNDENTFDLSHFDQEKGETDDNQIKFNNNPFDLSEFDIESAANDAEISDKKKASLEWAE